MPRVPRTPVGSGAVATAQGYRPRSVIPGSGVSRWAGEEESGSTWGDIWGGYDATLNGPTQNSDVPSTVSDPTAYSLSYDNVDDFANAGNTPDLNFGTSNFTMTCWVKSQNSNSDDGFGDSILSKGSNQGSGDFILYLDDNNGWRFIVGQSAVDIFKGSSVDVDTWKFLAASRNGDTFEIWSGDESSPVSPLDSQTNNVDLTNDREFWIGWTDRQNNAPWNDLISDPRAYSDWIGESRLNDIRTGNE